MLNEDNQTSIKEVLSRLPLEHIEHICEQNGTLQTRLFSSLEHLLVKIPEEHRELVRSHVLTGELAEEISELIQHDPKGGDIDKIIDQAALLMLQNMSVQCEIVIPPLLRAEKIMHLEDQKD